MMELEVILTSVTLPDKRPMGEKPLMRTRYYRPVDGVRTAGTHNVYGILHSMRQSCRQSLYVVGRLCLSAGSMRT